MTGCYERFPGEVTHITDSDFEVNGTNQETFGNGPKRRTRFSTIRKILSRESTHQLLLEHEDSFNLINFDYIDM